MEKLTTCFVSTVLLLAVLNSGLAADTFFGYGGQITLSPSFSEEINSIIWKHGDDMVAEWVKEKLPLNFYGTFEGRTSLDTTTGRLEIRKMSQADRGVYSVEINDNVQAERYNATLIEAVPKPTVLLKPLSCSSNSISCTLTCDGNTEEAEPVTYSWKIGGEVWLDGEKNRSITNDGTTQHIKTFTCRMKNPLNEEESEPIHNIFFIHDNNRVFVAVGVGVCLCLLALALGVGFWQRKAIQPWVPCLPCLHPSNPGDNHAPVNGQQGPNDVTTALRTGSGP